MSSEMMGSSPQTQEMNHGGFQPVVVTPFALPVIGLGMGMQHSSEQRVIRESLLGDFPSRRRFWSLLFPSCWDAGMQMWYLENINNSRARWSRRVERTMLAIAYLSVFYYVRKFILTIILGMVFFLLLPAKCIHNLCNPTEIPKCLKIYVQRFTDKGSL